MSKLNSEEQVQKTSAFSSKKSILDQDISSRNLLYQIRRAFYDGKVTPDTESGHDQITTQYATIIVDRFASYCAANGVSIKLKPWNTSDSVALAEAEKANEIADRMYNANKDFQYQLYLMHQTSGWSGDGYLDTKISDGVPVHKSMNQPDGVMLGFKDNNYDEYDYWMIEYPLSTISILDTYGVEVGEYPIFYQSNSGNGSVSSHKYPYGFDFSRYLKQGVPSGMVINRGMAKYSVLHDLVKEERVQLFNDLAYFSDKNPNNIYHFKANIDSGRPYGLSDFEAVAQIITKIDEKLSETSDAVSMSVHHKILTDLPTKMVQEKWRPNRTQAIKVRTGAQGNKFEILNTNLNTFDARNLIEILMNALRTGSGLQELGQDQVSANVSGRAIAYMFQGVTEKVTTKRLQLDKLLIQMVKDDFAILGSSDAQLKKMMFDENGTFKFNIKIKYPPVLEQEEQVRISNISTMTQTGLISKYSGRLLLTDYIDDPIEEEKRIQVEKKEEIEHAKQLESIANPPKPAVKPGGMEPVDANAGTGVVSTPGNAGTAQANISAQGMQDQTIQQTTA